VVSQFDRAKLNHDLKIKYYKNEEAKWGQNELFQGFLKEKKQSNQIKD
jgi:hypothetical protein